MSISLGVQSSISLVFDTAAGGCSLDNAGTNNVGVYMGYAVFTGNGTYSGCGTMKKLQSAFYQVSTPFQIVVTKYNSSSPSYSLAAWLSETPPTNVYWVLNPNASGAGTTLTTTAGQYYETANPYGSRREVLAVQVRNQVDAEMLTAQINFLATAN